MNTSMINDSFNFIIMAAIHRALDSNSALTFLQIRYMISRKSTYMMMREIKVAL